MTYPPGVTLTQEAYVGDDPPAAPPARPVRRRLVGIGPGGTLTQEFFGDDGPPVDAHYPTPLSKREAAAQVRAARDSILQPSFRGDE